MSPKDREEKVFRFLKEHGPATARIVAAALFDGRHGLAHQALTSLEDVGRIKRVRAKSPRTGGRLSDLWSITRVDS